MRLVTSMLLFFALAGCSDLPSGENGAPSKPDAPGGDIPLTATREKFGDQPGMEKITINDLQGALGVQGILVDGKKEGAWAEFNPDGTIKSVTPYIHGKKEGWYVEMGSNGQFVKRISFHNDVRHGAYVEYSYPHKKEERMYDNGKLDGMVKIYYPDGKVMEEGSYRNDTRDGVSKWYGTDGNVSIQYEYKNGELIKK